VSRGERFGTDHGSRRPEHRHDDHDDEIKALLTAREQRPPSVCLSMALMNGHEISRAPIALRSPAVCRYFIFTAECFA
jgi:hypothetical protein